MAQEAEQQQQSGDFNMVELSPGTQAAVVAFFIGLPFLGMAAEALGLGEAGLILGALAAGGIGYGAKSIIDQPGADKDGAERPRLRIAVLDKLREANWAALLPEAMQPTLIEEDEAITESQPAQGSAQFNRQTAHSAAQGIPRITVEQMVRNTIYNSYDLWIGRSLTQPGNAPVVINVYKKHLKVVGSSQQGKSSMAAALLKTLLATHDPTYLNVALLDAEDKTSRLFADDPHIMRVIASYEDRQEIKALHATNEMAVLETLEIICGVMDYRYTLDENEIEAQPLLIAYLEEFQALKEYFQSAISQAQTEKAEKQAKANYERLRHCIGRIARQGLKVLVQFLVCTQADYADEDFREMFVNIHSGFAFGLRPTTAQSAGFMQTELIRKNYESKQVGQCVAELSTCKDLILAPDFDLKAHLKALLPDRGPVYRRNDTINVAVGAFNGRLTSSASGTESPENSADKRLSFNVNAPENEHNEAVAAPINVSDDIREVIARMARENIAHRTIAKVVKLDGPKYATYRQVCKEMNISLEREA